LIDELHLTTDLADAYIASAATWNAKQDALVSGTNIKTINSTSILGSGDITIAAPTIYKSTTDSAGFIGTTNTAVYTQLIAANTFAAGDIIRVTYRARKTATSSNLVLRIYVNTTANLSGTPLLIGIWQGTGAYLMTQMIRHFSIKTSTNNTESFSSAANVASDFGISNGITNAAINWTNAIYFVFALQNGDLLSTNFGSMYLIEKL
jgi:hypothetical protein